ASTPAAPRRWQSYLLSCLSNHGGDCGAQRRLVLGLENAETPDDEALFKSCKHRLDCRRLEQVCPLPFAYRHLAHAGAGTNLTCDRPDHNVRPGDVVSPAA